MKKINENLLKQLVHNLLVGQGTSPKSIRQAIYQKVQDIVRNNHSTTLDNQLLEAYTEKIARHAYKITDRDIQELQDEGFSQAQIFELSATAALSAGKTRMDIIQELLKSKKS